MNPRTRIQLPIEAQERIDSFLKQERAANQASAVLMRTGIVDASGKGTTLLEIANSIGNADAIRDAAHDVFMALTMAGMTYREFSHKKDIPNSALPDYVRHAVRHFYYVMTDSHDLQSIGIGRGDLLLIGLDWHVARYLKANTANVNANTLLAS
jgi:hypothetical protein